MTLSVDGERDREGLGAGVVTVRGASAVRPEDWPVAVIV
jgi:hypothetical protein